VELILSDACMGESATEYFPRSPLAQCCMVHFYRDSKLREVL
jgi:hypothetical protein